MSEIEFSLSDEQFAALEALTRRQSETVSDVVSDRVLQRLRVEAHAGTLGAAPPLPEALVKDLDRTRQGLLRLKRRRRVARFKFWSLKAPIFAGFGVYCLLPSAAPYRMTLMKAAVLPLVVIDTLWRGREVRLGALKRACVEVEALIKAVPALWADACRTRSPEAAEAELLAALAGLREHAGALGIVDLAPELERIQRWLDSNSLSSRLYRWIYPPPA